ncbi:MAG: 3-(3-hydroxy-phenyl)propionate hydroxylase, partial [Rhodococcus erythropolis]|nr:3-(3-hydroxy-phenyl)propionate hydroxylase [Rhodococcus erythropolis]
MTLKHYPVVIVGAGPSGMTAASLLGRYSTNCLVLDRWASVFAQPRAVHLDDEIYRILGDLGIAEEFGSISRAGQGLRLIDSDMSTIAEFTRNPTEQPHGFPAANMFDQPALEAVLRARMDQGGNVTFRGHCEVSDVINERD